MKYFYEKKTAYPVSLIDMEIAHENVFNGEEECVFITEHEGLYSAGKSSCPEDFLSKVSLPIYYPSRGGKVTVHSKGQLVVYPIINLRKRGMNVSEFVKIIEDWMIEVLRELNIKGYLSEKGVGIWANGAKIGFVGIGISKGVSTHGLCLNVSNDTSHFDKIIPCGLKDIKITSIEQITGRKQNMKNIADLFISKTLL